MNQTDELIERAEEYAFHVYNRFPVVFDRGEGMYLYDTDDKRYLDFGSGIGVMAIGYGDDEYSAVLHAQVDTLLHTSNLYYHEPLIKAAEAATEAAGMDKVFFTNSGAEAIEGALKTAKKYALLRDEKKGKKPENGYEIIAMQHSFHGRTVGAVSVTGNDHYREPFYPLMDGVRFAEFNDLDSIKAAVRDNTCAIIMETVQGEGGIYPAEKAFIEGVRALCDERDILLILDEIQCGMGRTGQMFAYQHYGIRPDIMTSAKGLGGGVPVGAFMLTDKVAAQSLVPGDHGTTYGGNPLVCTAVAAMCRILKERDIPAHVRATEPYLVKALEGLMSRYDFITGRRGMGFMQGLVLTVPVGEVVKKALDRGLVVLSAGSDVLRLLPPLIATESDIDEMVSILGDVFDTF
ncbi:MAG: aspartate aminotransferase family protein [Lachnospiraceae bacterium]|nr:aspartate aminotransferase family protein [Lachnospiraceae bacterium]